MIGEHAFLRTGLHVCEGLGVEVVSVPKIGEDVSKVGAEVVSVAKVGEDSNKIKTAKYFNKRMMF